jgi:hypothetical protein
MSRAAGSTALSERLAGAMLSPMERVAHKAASFDDARRWELEQYRQMSPDERRSVAKALRERHFGPRCPDVRDAVAGVRRRRT